MSSRSSCGDMFSWSHTSSTGSRRPSRPAAISTEASVTSRANRSGRIVPVVSRLRPLASASGAARGGTRLSSGGSPRWRSTIRSIRSRASSTSSGGPRMRAWSRSPSAHEITSRGSA